MIVPDCQGECKQFSKNFYSKFRTDVLGACKKDVNWHFLRRRSSRQATLCKTGD